MEIKEIRNDNFLKQLQLLFGHLYLSKKPIKTTSLFHSLKLTFSNGAKKGFSDQDDAFEFLINTLGKINKSLNKYPNLKNLANNTFLGQTKLNFKCENC